MRSTIESIIVERPKPTEEHPQGMCLDKGYDYDEVGKGIGMERERGVEEEVFAREQLIFPRNRSPSPPLTSTREKTAS